MAALFHCVLHGLLGSLTAWASRTAPRAQARLWAWPLAMALSYAATVLLPISAYQFRFYPDFSMAYAFDPVLYPWADYNVGALGLVANLAYLSSLVTGYALTWTGLRRNRHALALIWPATCLATGAWALVALAGRNLPMGDYASYWRGDALPWTHAPSGILASVAYFVALLLLAQGQRRFNGRDPSLLGQL